MAVDETHGLVLTNWHVVCDATEPVRVVFPDGFRSGARVLNVNKKWDLAALAIWRPRATPVSLSPAAPRPGEPLTIAGYGPKGVYRAATGRCTQYVSPGGQAPFEIVELSTAARKGDSGGPIFNQRGELAGVLFGSGRGQTMGSYCGRVQWFLASVEEPFKRLSPGEAESTPETLIAQRPAATAPTVPAFPYPAQDVSAGREMPAAREVATSRPSPQPLPSRVVAGNAPNRPRKPLERSPDEVAAVTDAKLRGAVERRVTASSADGVPRAGEEMVGTLPPRESLAQAPAPHDRQTPVDVSLGRVPPDEVLSPEIPSRLEQIKTILAIFGLIALLFHGMRLLVAAAA